MYYRPFREQIEELLAERDWKWYDLAAELGISAGRMSHIKKGEGDLSLPVIERIAEVFEVAPDHFDVYVANKLPDLARSAPGLIHIGRQLLQADSSRKFGAISAKIAACA